MAPCNRKEDKRAWRFIIHEKVKHYGIVRKTDEIGYCLECRELNYAMTNANGTFERANMSNTHEGHKQYIFEAPEKYTLPIRNILTKLQVGLPISNNEIVLFKLAIDFGDLDEAIR